MEPIVELSGVTKLYGVVIGLNDVTLQMAPGVHGLLGPNGAGKSTLLKLITGQLKPTEGRVHVLGVRPWNHPSLFRQIGFCPEQDSLYSFLTGLEFVEMLMRVHGYRAAEARERAVRALELVNLQDAMHRRTSTYSRGMRQRAKIAQAIAHDPQLLIFDEPMSGLDPNARHSLTELLRGYAREGRSLILSSHVLHEVEALTQDFLLIYHGRILAMGGVREIREMMNDHPHRIRLKCGRPRELAEALVREGVIDGLEMGDDHGAITILTRAAGRFYERLPAAALACDAQVTEVASQDDNLDAVFRYLVRED